MSLNYALVLTEGPHDQAFVGKLLGLCGLRDFGGKLVQLDPFWRPLIPIYPRRGDLYARLNMPSIYISATHSVAVYHVEGKDNVLEQVGALMASSPGYLNRLTAWGLIVDADLRRPEDVARIYADKLRFFFPALSGCPGAVDPGRPRTGIYVLPDNLSQGTLDSLLLECAAIIYPRHKQAVEQFLTSMAEHEDHPSLIPPSALEKALVASIVSILRPGSSNTTSIALDNWVCERSVQEVPGVARLKQFLEQLLEIPLPARL
ncbi:MAG TPA: DUF3226 domain-containing protein [Ktedonobacteraceae bacterium]|nr:DUF3226 domain-containing protein [Ktedonobacteraceae bacterium]